MICSINLIDQDPSTDCKLCSLSDGSCRWAWNNTHITKRIAHEQRVSIPIKRSPRKGRTRKRLVRPPTSLKDKLSNLHLLLRVPSFSRWPLQVRFYHEDVYQEWQRCNVRVNASVRDGIKVSLDVKQPEKIINDGELPMTTKAKGKRKLEALGKGGIEGLDLGYSELKNHIEKSNFMLAEGKILKCAVCAKNLGPKTAMALVCPQEDCRIASHMTCLATKFIEDEGAGAAITPISGRCQGCKVELQWIHLIKELSLRVRGEKEVAKVTKKLTEQKTKTQVPKTMIAVASQPEAHTFEEEDVVDPNEDIAGVDMRALDASDESLPDDWQYQDDDNEDLMSVRSDHTALSDGIEAASPAKRPPAAPNLPALIEDSELDDTEFSD